MQRFICNRIKEVIPLCINVNRQNRIVSIKLPDQLKDKTIFDIINDDVNYVFVLQKHKLQEIVKNRKPNDTFLL